MAVKKKKRRILITLLFVLLALSLAVFIFFKIYSPLQAVEMILPDLKGITQVNARLKGDSVIADINFIFRNKSPFKIKVDTLHYRISLDTVLFIEESVPIDLDQIKGQMDTIRLPLNMSLKKFRSTLADLAQDDSTDLTMDTYVICHTIFGKIKIPFKKVQRIAVPVPPKVNVISVSRKRYHIRDKTLTAFVKIEIVNKSKMLDLSLREIKYHLVVKNNLSSQGSIKKTVNIRPSTNEYLELPVVIEMDRPLKTAIAVALDRDKFPYTLHMTCIIRENMVDEGHEMPFELNTSGIMELKE